MRIVSLALENTKSYAKGKIEFTDGVNAIVGHNGAGKSTILEAIGFALFDCLAGYKQSDFVREGTKTAEITVTIVSGLDDRSYQAVRRCGSSNHHAIYDPELGTKICEGKADVLHFLRQHMGVDPTSDLTRLFSDAVGVPQGTFTAAFLQTPAQRKAVFDPLLQVEEYKQAFDKLLDPLRTLQQQQHTLELEMAGYAGRLERLPALDEAIATRAQTLAQTAAQATAGKAALQQVSADRSTLDTIQQQVAALRLQQQQAEQQQHALSVQLQSAERTLAETQAADTIVQQHQAAYQQYLAAQGRQKELDQALRARQQLERQLNQLDKALGLTAAEVARYTQDLAAVANAETAVATLTTAVAEQEALEVRLQEAQQQCTRLEDAQRQLALVQQEYQQRQARLVTLEAQLAQVIPLEAERVAEEEATVGLRSQIDENKETLARFKVEADTLKEQSSALETIATALCPLCEQPLTPAHRHELQARNSNRLADLRTAYRTQQQTIKTAEEQLTATQNRLKAIQQRLRTMPREDERVSLQQEIATAQEAVAQQQERLARYAGAPEAARQLSQKLAALGDPRQQQAVAKAAAARRQSLVAQQAAAIAKQAATQAELTTIHEAMAQFATLDHDLETLAQALQATLNGYQQVLRYQQVASTLATRQAEVQTLHTAVATAVQAVSAAAAAVTTAEAQFDSERYQRLLAEEARLREQQQALQTELTLLQREQEREQEEQATLRRQQAELTTLFAQQQRLRQQTEVLEALRNLLRQAGPYITKALIKQISDGAMQVFSDIMQDYTRHLSWNEDYGITLEVDGRERQFAQLSGGEQMTAALAVRLALLREMSNIDVAFFDEPTTNLDETRRDALARQILEVKGFRQLFVISHDDTFEQATQNLIRIARVNGLSTVQQS